MNRLTCILAFLATSALLAAGPATQPSPGPFTAQIATQVSRLSDPSSDVRATAAQSLRTLLAAHPDAAPNRHPESYWKEKIALITKDMTVDQAFAILLPNATPDDLQKANLGADGSGTTVSQMTRIDDYWVLSFYYSITSNQIIPPPNLRRSARNVWLAPAADYTGPWTTFFVNGQKSHDIQYRDGKYDGTFIAYRDDGTKIYEQHYQLSICNGSTTAWHPDGTKMSEGAYKNGKRDGTWQHWYPSGKLENIQEYKDGQLDGTDVSWFENGQKQYETHYKADKRDGTDSAWDESGKQLWQHEYRADQLLGG